RCYLNGTAATSIHTLSLHDALPISGVDLAVQEINEAGGVLGQDVTVEHRDSSDTQNPQIASQSVSELVDLGVSAIIGAASSSVRSEEHTSELQSRENLVCRLLLEKK